VRKARDESPSRKAGGWAIVVSSEKQPSEFVVTRTRMLLPEGSSVCRAGLGEGDEAGWPLRHPQPDEVECRARLGRAWVTTRREAWSKAGWEELRSAEAAGWASQQWQAEAVELAQHREFAGGAVSPVEQAQTSAPRNPKHPARRAVPKSQGWRRVVYIRSPRQREPILLLCHSTLIGQRRAE
jgi:hypothetical protein